MIVSSHATVDVVWSAGYGAGLVLHIGVMEKFAPRRNMYRWRPGWRWRGDRKNVRRPVGQTEPCRSVGTPFRGHCDLCSIDGIRTHTKALGPRSFPLVKRYSLNYYAKNQLIKLCDQYIRSRLPTGRKLGGIASWTHVGFEPLRLRAKEKCYRYTTWPMDYCTSGGTRTHNPGIKSAMLCQLSYKGGYWGHRWDSNPKRSFE